MLSSVALSDVNECSAGGILPCKPKGERKAAAFARGLHVVMRQRLVPGISFHAKFEVPVPNVRGDALLHLARRHMIIKFCAARHCMPQRRENLTGSLEDFGNRIN